MAKYTYECKLCGVMEIEHSIKDEALQKCPKCGNMNIVRLIGKSVGVVFKGSGFYQTDYKNKGETK